jgi:hypothetical protein
LTVKKLPRHAKRFPRLEMSSEEKFYEKIILHTWNKLAVARSMDRNLKYNPRYDIYKTKRGWAAQIAFKILAMKLAKLKIDPATYIGTICRYGKFSDSTYMPPPGWVVKDSAVEIFSEWLYKKERNHYIFEKDWKDALKVWDESDIVKSVKASAVMVQGVHESNNISQREAWLLLEADEELSQWYLAICRLEAREFTDVRRSIAFLKKHPSIRKVCRKAVLKIHGKQFFK